MYDKKKIDEIRRQAYQAVEKVKEMLAKEGELSDADQAKVDEFLQNADKLEKRAKQLELVMEKDIERADAERHEKEDREKAEAKKKSAVVKFDHGWEFLKAVINARLYNRWDPRLTTLQVKSDPRETHDMAGEVGVSGGFLIPAGQAQEILTARGEAAFVRPRARVVPMSSRVVPFPVLDYSQGAAGVNAFTGGIRVYWTEENTNITESQPTFKNVDLHARGLAGYVEIPNGLIQDSAISLEAFLSGPNGFGGALAAEEDYQALNGNGAGKFMGIIGSPGELTVTRNTSSDFKFVDAVTMMSKMLMTSAPVWVINQSVMPKLLQFADAASFNIFVLNASMGLSGTLLGIPIDWTGKNPALGTKGDVCLVDWGFYLIGDRQQITVDVDRSYKFQADQTALRIVERVDGQPWLATTITLMDGSTTVSPYVVLN